MNIIKTLRKNHKKTQVQLANALGITQSAYSMYEGGYRTPPTDILQKLADYYNVSIDYLLGRVDNPTTITLIAPTKTYMKNLRSLRKHQHLTMKEFGDIFELSESAISLYETGNREPDEATISKFADYFDVSVDYLLGRTENRNTFPNTNELPPDYEPKYAIPHTQNDLLDIPILGNICAGNGIIADEHIDGYEPTSRHSLNGHPSSDFYWLRIEGDSMEPDFKEGDLVLVRRQTSIDSGQIAAVLVDGEEGVIKRVEYGRDWIELISENPNYETRRFEGPDVLRVYVMGLIIESKRKIAR